MEEPQITGLVWNGEASQKRRPPACSCCYQQSPGNTFTATHWQKRSASTNVDKPLDPRGRGYTLQLQFPQFLLNSCWEHLEYLCTQVVISSSTCLKRNGSASSLAYGYHSSARQVPTTDYQLQALAHQWWNWTFKPKENMQFRHTLECCLYTIHQANPPFEPIHQAKVDLSDGLFYRERLHMRDILHLCVAFSTYKGKEPMVASPLVLCMEQIESLLWLCTAVQKLSWLG